MIFLPEDREICEALLRPARDWGRGARPFSEIVVAVGLRFLGAPYAPGTLEQTATEELVVNLRGFDCVTFVESSLALARTIRRGQGGFGAFAAALEQIRYRGGRRRGYPSRLHYFTDWLRDNDRKGIVREITAALGGAPCRMRFHAITDHWEDHPALKDRKALAWMRRIETLCSQRTLWRVAKDDGSRAAERIADGDIIAVTTDREGLDVSHAGFAVHHRGRLRLLHASSREGKVVLSEMTLGRYLLARRSRTGIMVGRPIPERLSGLKFVKA